MRFGRWFWIDFPRFYFTAIRLFFGFSLRSFWRVQARDSGNRAIRDLRFCAAKFGNFQQTLVAWNDAMIKRMCWFSYVCVLERSDFKCSWPNLYQNRLGFCGLRAKTQHSKLQFTMWSCDFLSFPWGLEAAILQSALPKLSILRFRCRRARQWHSSRHSQSEIAATYFYESGGRQCKSPPNWSLH